MKEYNDPNCWKCNNQDILWISETIFCKIKGCIVYPWEANNCTEYNEYVGQYNDD
jgi:hypothetical protein